MKQIPIKQIEADKQFVDLYAKREAIHVRAYKGFYRNLRVLAAWPLLLAYFLTPFITWGNRQAIWFDLPQRQFHIFGLTFWPQDFALLSGLLILAAFVLFFVTVFAGRIWCGYSCPQTVFTYVFMRAERLAEGNRNARIKLDSEPMSFTKFRKKALKHFLWLMISAATALAFVGYFTPIRELIPLIYNFNLGLWEAWWLAFFLAATYINAGWMREQVCTYMCPYARFQSVMFDSNTLIVTYDEKRGEPRGKGSRKEQITDEQTGEVLGDCVDCGVCVTVCPVGIDIRDGLQYECISCAACVDACNEVMLRINKPTGLIRYATENVIQGNQYRLVSPRLIGYAIAVCAIAGLLALQLFNRHPLEVNLIRDRQALYRDIGSGVIENTYYLKISNKGQQHVTVSVGLTGIDYYTYTGPSEVYLEANTIAESIISIRMHVNNIELPNTPITFSVKSSSYGDLVMTQESRFIAPTEQLY
ncbi:MAG: cytochrome c oxidase accessory protein CcoG [Gammaproteobacteria bacterium]|nr:cytochrome c oxidase accessory protein CcoG [Gammaproteobacteria bacterium]